MPKIQEFFKWGLDRDIPELLEAPGWRSGINGKMLSSEITPLQQGWEKIPHINLGPGDRKIIPGTVGVGPASNKLTEIPWTWQGLVDDGLTGTMPVSRLPFANESVGAVHVHQFMEHFAADDALGILGEIERVLVPGGVVFMTTPYPGYGHFTQALDHKSMWTEETWDWLFNNTYYNHSNWKLRVHACFLMAVVHRNLDLFTQLVKE